MREIFVLSCTNSSNYENFLEKHSSNFQCQNLKKKKTQCMIQHPKERKEGKRKKNKNGGILCFSSANSTNYANFLEIFLMEKKPCTIEQKEQKMGFKKKVIANSTNYADFLGKKILCHKIEIKHTLYNPTERKKGKKEGKKRGNYYFWFI